MLAISFLAFLLSLTPGDGLGLAPGPETGGGPVSPGGPAPTPPALPIPVVPGAAMLVAGAAVMLAGRRQTAAGAELGGGSGPVVVFVAGHGNGSAEETFADLIAMMGTDHDDARFFDYRWAIAHGDGRIASQDAAIDDVVDALNGYLAGVAEEGRPIRVIGFSKGGAAIAELLARWDAVPTLAIPEVEGAVLLDPPISAGILGEIQSIGRYFGPVPDDGGYDPVECGLWMLGCRDDRSGLGEAAGVPVAVIRNPKAGITNLGGLPEGLLVYDAADDGPGFLETLFTKPWTLPSRVSEAHEAVLYDPDVAACILAEMDAHRSCDLPQPGRWPGPVSAPTGGRGARLGLNYTL